MLAATSIPHLAWPLAVLMLAIGAAVYIGRIAWLMDREEVAQRKATRPVLVDESSSALRKTRMDLTIHAPSDSGEIVIEAPGDRPQKQHVA